MQSESVSSQQLTNVLEVVPHFACAFRPRHHSSDFDECHGLYLAHNEQLLFGRNAILLDNAPL